MSKKTQNQSRGKAIPVKEGDLVFVGADVHKKQDHVALSDKNTERIVSTWCQPPTAQALIDRLEPIRLQVVRIFYEAGPTGFGLARHLQAAGYDIEVISPAHTPRCAVRKAKTDGIDCRNLALLGAKGDLHPVCIPTVQQEEDRQLVRLRGQRVDRLKGLKLQVKSFLLCHGLEEPRGLRSWSAKSIRTLRAMELTVRLRKCFDLMLDDLQRAIAAVTEIDAEIRALSATPPFEAGTKVCVTVPGIAVTTAMGFQTEMFDPGRFHRATEVSSFQGLAPGVEGSGDKLRQLPLMKTGNPRLRTLLVEAAWNWVRHDPGARRRYYRLLARIRVPQKAIVAMARQLGIILWRMVTRNEPYRPEIVPDEPDALEPMEIGEPDAQELAEAADRDALSG